ncbi:MAG: tRNA (adenosine(37)-N6)-dimethylallyltransferase MiaA [Daejeonella sp.]|uniref:tRNA (adenosine(37)-N6)-dimethylallyltransferase MiaA n=1 Tax=Daejeonella sp. JGW-45 TaxID=3034148 RepID=UPI0023ED9112|nr:tRNA (adenosine(37)-N6)-dimethylallyltransferase MiaA [Daejeonella sp. JGW-45]
MAKTLIIITGPTAIGKTSLAIQLATHYQTEIVSADSRQFYREMDIGTAKPSSGELMAVKHHFINSHSIVDNFNVGDYEKKALELIEDLFSRHNVIIVVGGSGLFINAITNGFDELPSSTKEIREKLNQLFRDKGIAPLQEKLKRVDQTFYTEVDINNPQRLIRALEVYEATGKPFSEFRKRTKKQRSFNIVTIGLNTDRKALYKNIDHRVDLMIEAGLVKEAEGLKEFRHLNPLNTVGYSELFDYFDGLYTLEEAVEKIKQNTRRFAKRQLTWFNKSENIKWFEPADDEKIFSYLDFQLKNLELPAQKS